MKLQEFTEKYQDLTAEQKEDLAKVIQGEQDAIRTDYSKKIKDLEQFKPVELTDEQKELATLRNEVNNFKFKNSLREMGIPNDLAGFIDSRIDIEEVRGFFEGFDGLKKLEDYVPTGKNIGDSAGITKEQFRNMNYAEKAKLYSTDAELYSQLSQ